ADPESPMFEDFRDDGLDDIPGDSIRLPGADLPNATRIRRFGTDVPAMSEPWRGCHRRDANVCEICKKGASTPAIEAPARRMDERLLRLQKLRRPSGQKVFRRSRLPPAFFSRPH